MGKNAALCLSSSLAPLVRALSSLLSVGGGKKAVLKGFGVNPHGNLTGLYAKATQVMLCLSYAELSKLRKLACLL